MKNYIERHQDKFLRLLEILPGFVSWNLILFPYWGILVIPNIVAYFILAFNIYWFYQSLQVAIFTVVSHLRIQASMNYDWMGDVKNFPDWQKVRHAVIIVNYKEPLHILERVVNSLAKQELPKDQLIVVLAMEKSEPEESRNEKIAALKKQFGKTFKNLIFTVHELIPGEMQGKSSNEKFAAMYIKNEFIDKRGDNIDYYTVSSCDADHVYHPKHFACLTYKFLDNPRRYKYFWQSAVVLYNNIWKLPAITRVNNTMGSIWNMAVLSRKDKLIVGQNYSLSLKLLHEVGYWDADKIPEDWGIFFKALYKTNGDIETDPIYLPLYADAAESGSFVKTVKNQYEQYKRWAWGVSDAPWIIMAYLMSPKISFINKTMRLKQFMWTHFMWPVNWFLITIGLTIPTLLNPAFSRTALGYTVPKVSSFVLTLALGFLIVMLIIERSYKPTRPKEFPLWRSILMPFEFVLMPITGFIFGALPGLDAHTRLMLGKYMKYRVTEKV